MPPSSMTEGTIGERSTRRDAPLVCVTGGQHHVRQFLREALSDLADSYGARTVAEGVETWADFLTVR
jgi:hypothetical protein